MNFFNRNKTLKPVKPQKDGKRKELSQFAQHTLATLGSGSMLQAVKLPKGEDEREWIATHTCDFYNELSMLYGTISEYCTRASCPQMCAGDSVKYLWADGVKIKKPIEVSAPEYVDLLMTWVESMLNDETIFPIKFDSSYPKKFKEIASTIYKRFFRIYAHIYHSHFKQIQAIGADAHLNTCFKHFVYFILEFKLVEPKELTPLQSLIDSMMGADRAKLVQPIATPTTPSGAASSSSSATAAAASPPAAAAAAAHAHTPSADDDSEVVRGK